MKEIKDIQTEASTLEIDLTHVVNKTRDGSSLFQLLADHYEKIRQEKNGTSSHHKKKNLAECRSDFLTGTGHDESDWADVTSHLRPVNVTSTSTSVTTAEYFDELDRQWASIRRTPTLDVADKYSAPVVLSSILRPFLSMGAHFNFSMSPELRIPFDLGASYPPVPPLSEAEEQKRLKRLMSRLEALYKKRRSSTNGIVDLPMLQSFVDQMKENDKVIQSFENISYSSPIEPATSPPLLGSVKTDPFGGRRRKNTTDSKCKGTLFSVKQLRNNVHRRSKKHDEWEKQKDHLLAWDAADEESVTLV